ncbi:hypothetical protein CTEN210_12886 [Chaetoceros tenuissimus]|uniref:Leucine-rich repeat domain-containing protein n=1 Tax=Chaetoceros tenuissimus TaxID=426638 RepID=A0AAD3D4K1_9STRA|nr:hypothetical protein CTEN210_12886 [Chaetoceros tenuissimus]
MRTEVVDGLLTLFYDGSKNLFNANLYIEYDVVWQRLRKSDLTKEEKMNYLSPECQEYVKERWTWEQVIVEEGVTFIQGNTFALCYNIESVIFANTVTIIEDYAFYRCKKLACIKLSVNLESVGRSAFHSCKLSSVFLPPRCRIVHTKAFARNKNLINLVVPRGTELGPDCITGTKLAEFAPRLLTWIKNINADDKYALHRACASYNPLKEVIFGIIEEKGLKAFKEKNEIGITPSRYLQENPYTDLSEMDIVRDYMSKKLNFQEYM